MKIFKKKEKMYFGIWNDESDYLLTSAIRPLEVHKKEGINPRYSYYEIDLEKNTIIPVKMELLALMMD